MMLKEYASKQISLISLKYGIILTSNHWILYEKFLLNEKFAFLKKYFTLYFKFDFYAALTLKYRQKERQRITLT